MSLIFPRFFGEDTKDRTAARWGFVADAPPSMHCGLARSARIVLGLEFHHTTCGFNGKRRAAFASRTGSFPTETVGCKR